MDVQMGHGFAGVGAMIDHQTVAGIVDSEIPSDVAGGGEHPAQDGGVLGLGLADARDGLFWEHDDMYRGLGIDVADDEEIVFLVDDLGGDLPAGDFLE
jgi:hypothetical protein